MPISANSKREQVNQRAVVLFVTEFVVEVVVEPSKELMCVCTQICSDC